MEVWESPQPQVGVLQEPTLPWQSKAVIRILMLVAQMLCLDPEWKQEVKHLANHLAIAGKYGVS